MKKLYHLTLIVLLSIPFTGTAHADADCEAEKKTVEEHIAKFDDLDFNRFSKAKDLPGFKHTHTENVVVHWPDGHTTKGIKKHLEDMEYMFSYAPDTTITAHPIKIGQGEWTAVYGIMEGTFTKPMKLPNGKTVKPTGKKFKIGMTTFAHWNKDGLFDEEYLMWDNQTFMQQIGLAQ